MNNIKHFLLIKLVLFNRQNYPFYSTCLIDLISWIRKKWYDWKRKRDERNETDKTLSVYLYF